MTTEGERSPRRRRKWGWAVVTCALVLVLAALYALRRPRVEPGTILVLDLRSEVEERAPEGLSRLFEAPEADLFDVWRALDEGSRDPRVAGVLVKVEAGGVRLGMIDELRRMIDKFRAAGKFSLAHASAPDTLGYCLAAACDEVQLDPSTTLDATGIRLQAFFLKDAFQKLGLEPDFLRVGDFKGSWEELSLPGPTPEFEESMNSLADAIFSSVAGAVASGRSIDVGSASEIFDRCPLPSDQALERKYVDSLGDGAAVLTRLEEKAGGKVHLLPLAEYLYRLDGPSGKGPSLAVIHVLGTIVEGESRNLPFLGASTGAETTVRDLRGAAEDPGVAGILLRVDSPGGVVSASEKIFLAVEAARKKKPIVSSMSSAAASGGYYAACAAEKVFAHPTTLTGSIGIFGGKVVLEEALERHGVEVRAYARGRRARLSDFTRKYDAEERLALRGLLEEFYRKFVQRVAASRGKSFDEIHSVAQGRVWTGRAALEKGLVDELGGLGEALDALRSLARLPPGPTSADARLYPPRASLWQSLTRSRKSDMPLVLQPGKGRSSLPLELDWLEALGLLDGSPGFPRLALMPFSLFVR